MPKRLATAAGICLVLILSAIAAFAWNYENHQETNHLILDWLDNDYEVQSLLDDVRAQLGAGGQIGTEINRGREVIFTFVLGPDVSQTSKNLITDLIDAYNPIFDRVAKEISEGLDLDNMRITVRLLDNERNEIAERIFNIQ